MSEGRQGQKGRDGMLYQFTGSFLGEFVRELREAPDTLEIPLDGGGSVLVVYQRHRGTYRFDHALRRVEAEAARPSGWRKLLFWRKPAPVPVTRPYVRMTPEELAVLEARWVQGRGSKRVATNPDPPDAS